MGSEASEYPTDQQIDESYKAYRENGREGILAFLKEQRRKREADAAVLPDPETAEKPGDTTLE